MAETLRLGDHCLKIGSGATPRGGKDSYLEAGPYRLIRSQNVHNAAFSQDGLASISEEQAAALSNVEVLPEDVLLNITGDSVARSCQVDPSILPARVNQHVAIIRPDPKIINPRFLRFFLIAPEMQSLMLSYAGVGATRNALTKSMIEDFKIPKISASIQREIGTTLGALEDKIELNRQSNRTLEAMAQALFQDWFVDFGPTRAKIEGREPYLAPDLWALFPDRLDNETGLPEGWRLGTLSDVANTNAESWTTRNHPDVVEYVDLSNTKWGNIESISQLSWGEAPSRARRIAKTGDTLVGTTRPGNGSFSYVARDGLTASTGFAVLTPRAPKYRDITYIAATRPENIARLANLADGHGGAYPAVNANEVSDTELPIADDHVMLAFSRCVAPLRDRIERAKEESHTLAQTRDLLLPKLMSGEIRLRDAEKIAGEVL